MRRKRLIWIPAILFSLLIMASSYTALAASLQLVVTSVPAGGTAVAVITLQNAADVESFALSLDFSSGATLTLPAGDYFTRGDYYPERPFGPAPQVEGNHFQETAAGTRVYFSGFYPHNQSGAIGTLIFDVSETAEIGDTQVLTLSGQYRSSTGTYELMPERTTTFIVADTVIRHDVSPSINGGNGSITSGSVQTVDSGDTVQFTIDPADGYEINTIDGTCGGSLNNNVFTTFPVTDDCSVIVSFHIPTYMVIPSVDGGNGSIIPNSVQIVNKNEVVQLTLDPADGYEVNSVGGTCSGSLNGNIFTTNPISGVCSVIAGFRISTGPTYSVTPGIDGGDGTISPASVQNINRGETAQFTLEPADGYEINTVASTCGGSLKGAVFTTNNVFLNCTVTADFRLEGSTLYTITPSAGDGGTISPDMEKRVSGGTEVSFILTPDPDYHIRQPLGGTCPAGVFVEINDGIYNYTTGGIVEDCTIHASFAKGTAFNWNLFLPAILAAGEPSEEIDDIIVPQDDL